MTEPSTDPVYFQKKYAWANNVGRVVGFTPSELLVLERDAEPDSWRTTPLSPQDVIRIRVRRARSLYVLFMAVVATLVGGFVAYAGLSGEATGLGVLTVPLVCFAFAYFCFTGSMRIHILFDLGDKKRKYKSWPGTYQETQAAIPPLLQWASQKGIAVDMEFDLPATK
jgi:hypothetical protein